MNLVEVAMLIARAAPVGLERDRALSYLGDLIELGVFYEQTMAQIALGAPEAKKMAAVAVIEADWLRRKYSETESRGAVN